jgi:hypothetical protein
MPDPTFPESINIAIAKASGWTNIDTRKPIVPTGINPETNNREYIPDFYNNTDLLQNILSKMSFEQSVKYTKKLEDILCKGGTIKEISEQPTHTKNTSEFPPHNPSTRQKAVALAQSMEMD